MSADPVMRRTTFGMSRMLFVASLLVFAISVPLLLATENTAELFAWTIRAPITAMFLGSAYVASGLAELASSREPLWANARVTVPPVFVFTTVTLLVTVVNRDAFHFGPEHPLTARAVAWIWLVVYAIVPVILGWLWLEQRRRAGADPPRDAPLAWWARGSLLVHAAVMLPLGVVMLIAPATIAPAWPWPLTTLTAQAIGAWSLGLGFGAAAGAREDDWRRLRAASPTYAVFGLLGLVTLARYDAAMRWGEPAAWLLVAMLASFVVGGGVAWRRGTRAMR